jgi:hypothetical protein
MRAAALAIAALVPPATSHAQAPQQPPQMPPSLGRPIAVDDAMLVAQGWLLLSQGSPVQAVERARMVLAKSPFSPGAIVLALEGEIVRGGSNAGLAEYERWLGARTTEEPVLLRRVCQAILREAAAQTNDVAARMNALGALAAHGDATAASTLREAMAGGDLPAATALAEAGDPEAVRAIVDKINSGALEPVRGLKTLGRTRSPEAATAAIARLDSPRSEVLLTAIQALRDLRSRAAVSKLRPLLQDQRSFIRIAAAEALLAAGDDSGMSILRELAVSDTAEDRLKAAEAMADKPDAAWLEMVRQLTTSSEPEVRLGAARLIAPHDPELAASVISGLRQDPNPAVRTMTSDMVLRRMQSSLSQLRGMLHSASLEERVIAAERVLNSAR